MSRETFHTGFLPSITLESTFRSSNMSYLQPTPAELEYEFEQYRGTLTNIVATSISQLVERETGDDPKVAEELITICTAPQSFQIDARQLMSV